MIEKRSENPAYQNLPQSSARSSPLPLDVKNHIRAREAVGAMLDRQKKVFISRRTYFRGTMTARILLDGKYYDCNARELARIQEGARPEDIGVEEIPTYDYGDDED